MKFRHSILAAAGLAAAAVQSAEGAKRPVYMYANSFFTLWGNMCPDLTDMINKGVTTIVMAFMVDSKPLDSLAQWVMNGKPTGDACIQEIHALGGKIIISSGGATEHAFDKTDATAYATAAAKFVVDYGFDGLDFDIEGLPPGFAVGAPAVYNWLRDVSITARNYFDTHGDGRQYIVAHAPQAPYMTSWGGDASKPGYGALAVELGDVVDHYLIQYYNQGDCRYDSYSFTWLDTQGCWDGNAAWNNLINYVGGDKHIQDKFVVGKITSTADGSVGYLTPNVLADALCKAEKEIDYVSGVMLWQFRGPNDPAQNAMLAAVGGDMCGDGGPPPANTRPPVTNPPVETTRAPVTAPVVTTPGVPGEPIVSKQRPVFMYINVYFRNPSNPCEDIMEMAQQGVTHIVISFLLHGIADDGLEMWMNFSGREQCTRDAHALGVKLIMSTGGEGEQGMYSTPAIEYGTRAAQAALDWGFDGLDFDLEHLGENFGSSVRYQWLIDATVEARKIFDAAGRSDMIIAHAPQSPYFAAQYSGPNAGYVQLVKDLGDIVDYYLVQFYNQGTCRYETYDSIFSERDEAGCWCVGCTYGYFTKLIGDKHLIDKIVVGKPANSIDAGGGHVESSALADIMCRAEKELGYTAGLMTWSYRAGMMSNFYSNLVTDMCNDGYTVTPRPSSDPGSGNPNPVTKPPPTNPPATRPPPPPVSAPFEGTCMKSTDNLWWHMNCNDAAICQPSELSTFAECVAAGGAKPYYWAPNETECRRLMFEGGRCQMAPADDGDAWDAPEAGRQECYVTDTWWAACSDSKVCAFDGRFKTESSCLNSGYPFSVWADTKAECITAVTGKACS